MDKQFEEIFNSIPPDEPRSRLEPHHELILRWRWSCSTMLFKYLQLRIFTGFAHRKLNSFRIPMRRNAEWLDRRVKFRTVPMLGFKSVYTARRVLIGIELMHKIVKGQYQSPLIAATLSILFGKWCSPLELDLFLNAPEPRAPLLPIN